jgi:hypothetical protein
MFEWDLRGKRELNRRYEDARDAGNNLRFRDSSLLVGVLDQHHNAGPVHFHAVHHQPKLIYSMPA